MIKVKRFSQRFMALIVALILLGNLNLITMEKAIAQSGDLYDPAVALPTGYKTIVSPPGYFRPDANSWQLDLEGKKDANNNPILREPINLIVYGPPDTFSYPLINEAMQTLSRSPRQIYVLPYMRQLISGDRKWLEYAGKTWAAVGNPVFGRIGIFKECSLPNKWTPSSSIPRLSVVAIFATTNCPAVLQTEPEFQNGVQERNHFRIWDYQEPVNSFKTDYLSASNEENFAVPGRCESVGIKPGLAHCLTDMNDSRDEVALDITAGASSKGWKNVTGRFDLTGQYNYENLEPGPYNWANPTNPLFPQIPRVFKPGTPVQRGAWKADGRVAIVCLDKNNTDYCDKKPVERPVAFNELSPGEGKVLGAGYEQEFSIKLGYSDQRRSIATAQFTVRYKDTTGVERSISPTTPVTVTSLAGGEYLVKGKVLLPTNAKLYSPNNTQRIFLDINACDSVVDNGYRACWQYKNLNYILENEPYRVVLKWNVASDVDLHVWGPTNQHSYYSNKTTNIGQLDLDDTTTIGPETFRANGNASTATLSGRHKIGVNCFNGCAGVAATIEIYAGSSTPQVFGPFTFTASNRNSGYPVTGNTTSWWRPADLVITDLGGGNLSFSITTPSGEQLPL